MKTNTYSLPSFILGLVALFVLPGWLLAAPGRTQHLSDPSAVPEGLSASDWSSIRAAYEAQRHAVVATEDGFRARNFRQQWLTQFDARGFLTQPDAGGWQWGLELRSYGFAGQQRAMQGKAEVTGEGRRVVYRWDGVVQEWFVNDQRGLEHGFSVQERPAHRRGGRALGIRPGGAGRFAAESVRGREGGQFCEREGRGSRDLFGA